MGLLILPTENNNKLPANVKRPNKKPPSNVSTRAIRGERVIKKASRNPSPKKNSLVQQTASVLQEVSEFTYISEDSGLGADIMSDNKKGTPVEGQTVLPGEDELAVAACAPVVLDKAPITSPAAGPTPNQAQAYRRVERCSTPVWFQNGTSDRPGTPIKRKVPTSTNVSFEDEKRRRVEAKTPLEELSALGSRSPDQFSAGGNSTGMQPVFTAFESNMEDSNQDFGIDGFDSDSMDSDESDSSLPSDEESDSDIDSDSAEWFESGPARIDEEMCRKNWTQNVYASKTQCWGGEKRVPENCGKPNCPCGDELYLRRRNAYHRRRQVVFNLSVSKLGRYRQAANPSLLRSVLVCNTLRNLEKEFEKEGVRFSVGAHGNLLITRSCPPMRCNNRPPATWSQRRMMRQNQQQQQQHHHHHQQNHQLQIQQQQQHQQQLHHHHNHHQQNHHQPQPQQHPHHGSLQENQVYHWNTRDCGNCGNCANCANMRSSHCFQCGKPHNVCRNSCRDYRSENWQEYRQSDYDYWQRCRYRRPGFNRWPSPTPRYPADYKERVYRDYRDEYFNDNSNRNNQRDSFQSYQESEWVHNQQNYSNNNNRYSMREHHQQAQRMGPSGAKDVPIDERLNRDYGMKEGASSVLFAELNEDGGRLTPFVAFRDEPLTDYDTVDRLLNSVSVLNFGNTVPVATPVATSVDTSDMNNSQLLTLTAPWESPPHAESQENQTVQDANRNASLPQDNQLLTLTTPWKSPPHESPMFGSTASAEKLVVQHDMTENNSYVDPIAANQDRYDLYAKNQPPQSLQPTNCYQDFQSPQQQQQPSQQQQSVSYPLQDMTPRYANCGRDWEGEWNQEWPSYWGLPDEGRSVLAS